MKLIPSLFGGLFSRGGLGGGGTPTTANIFDEYAFDRLVEYLISIPDPDDVLERAGLQRRDLRRLEGDDEIATALETRQAAVETTPWRLEPGEGDDYQFIHDQIKPRIHQMIGAAWRAVPYGYSVQEVTYGREGGRIVIASVAEKPFEWFAPRAWTKKPEDVRALEKLKELGYPIPDHALNYWPNNTYNSSQAENVHLVVPGKFFVTRRRATNDRNPYGEALLSRAYWPWYFRTAGWKFWAKFLERSGSPLLVGKTPNSTSDLAEAMARALQSAVAAVGKDDEIASVGTANNGASFDLYTAAVDKRIQKLILGQTLTTDVGKNGGALATARVQDQVRDDRRMADVRMVTPTIQAIIDTLLVLNRRPAGSVVFTLEDEVGLQEDRAARDATLVNAGMVKFTSEYLMRAYDLEETDFSVPDEKPAAEEPQSELEGKGAAPGGAKASALLAATAERAQMTPAQRAIEALGDDVLFELASPIPTASIRSAIQASTGPEDLANRLAELFDGTDLREFRQALERALFAADVMGYGHTQDQQ